MRDERLDPRVADVLELLPVRRVHVGLVRVTAAPCASRRRRSGGARDRSTRTSRAARRGYALNARADVRDGERLVGGLHRDLDVAERPPPQRRNSAIPAAIGQEAIAKARHDLALDLVAIALLALRAVRVRRRAAPRCRSARSTAPRPPDVDDLRIRRRQMAAIQQRRSPSSSRGSSTTLSPASTPAGTSPPLVLTTFSSRSGVSSISGMARGTRNQRDGESRAPRGPPA